LPNTEWSNTLGDQPEEGMDGLEEKRFEKRKVSKRTVDNVMRKIMSTTSPG